MAKVETSSFRVGLGVLSKRDRIRVFFISLIQILLSVLDLLALAVFGLVGTIAVKGINSPPNTGFDLGLLSFLPIRGSEFQEQVAILALVGSILLISKSILSLYMHRKMLFFLSTRGAIISANLVARLLSQNYEKLKTFSEQESLYALTHGVSRLMLGVLGGTLAVISDLALLALISVGLYLVNPILALCSFVIFAIIALSLHLLLSKRAQFIGAKSTNWYLTSNELVLQVLSSFREAVVRNSRGFYYRKISESRFELARLDAEMSFMPLLSKYVLEISMVFSALLISAIQFILNDAVQAIASLSLFLVAGLRIAPAILRVQQGILNIKNSKGATSITVSMLKDLPLMSEEILQIDNFPGQSHNGFQPSVSLRDVKFSYLSSNKSVLQNVSLEILPGQIVAFVGTSGAGKSTLVDLILGVLDPTGGSIEINGLHPHSAILKNPGAIAYVPQSIAIFNGTVRDNICIGFKSSQVDEKLIWEVLDRTSLSDLVRSLPEGLDTPLGDFGTRFSGGQKQRLGIARALITNPKLIILDESTSALDAVTEEAIVSSILSLRGEVTVIMIAHRLSSVKESDLVVFLDNGEVLAQGTFGEVRAAVPDFERQARLLGL